MGNVNSITGLPEGYATDFDESELKRMFKKFSKLDVDKSGKLTPEELYAMVPQLKFNPLAPRIYDVMDADGDGEIDFKEFLDTLANFTLKADKEAKLKFAFRIYDIDKDGYISNGELFQVLRAMVGENMHDVHLQQTIDKSIIYHDPNRDGKISYEEFRALAENLEIDKKMVLDMIAVQQTDQPKDQSKDQTTDQSKDQTTDQSKDQPKDQSKDQTRDQSKDQSADQRTDETTDHTKDNHTTDHATNNATKEETDQGKNHAGNLPTISETSD